MGLKNLLLDLGYPAGSHHHGPVNEDGVIALKSVVKLQRQRLVWSHTSLVADEDFRIRWQLRGHWLW